ASGRGSPARHPSTPRLTAARSDGLAEGETCRAPGPLLKGLRLVDEHHRDVVFDAVSQSVRLADQPGLILGELELSLALGASEHVEQLFGDHTRMLSQ